MSNSNMMNEYFNEMSKYLTGNSDSKEASPEITPENPNLDKEKLFESFMLFQKNYLKTQPSGAGVPPQNGSMSTSNGSEGFNKGNKSMKHEDQKSIDYHVDDKPVITFQNNTNEGIRNFDDIPIVPKVTNFEELLNKQLQNSDNIVEHTHHPIRKIKYEPRPRRSDLLNISKPTETKKYKYYSQNFNKDFGKDEDEFEKEVVEKPKEKQPVRESSLRPRTVKQSIQDRDKRMKE
jgi:hypothetical protein